MAKKTTLKKKKTAGKKPVKKTTKPVKKVVKKRKTGIPFKAPFGNITISGNAQPTAPAPPGMSFPLTYQLTLTGKNKNLLGEGQQQVLLSFVNGFWIFPAAPVEAQQQGPIQQIANSIGNIIISFYQKKSPH